MKKKLRLFLPAVLAFLIVTGISAQTINLADEIPLDPSIRTGKLENGLTYYLKHNSKPEKRLELRLVVNAGSVLEDEDQLGLAHFMEHMAFNGTKHFEKNELVSFLQSLGIKFGPDLNAYTSFDETVYMLTLPSDSAHMVKSGMQILEDWAHNLSLDNEEIDKERGVIIEEWRQGRGAQMRMLYASLPVIFKDSKYANRIPIGEKDIIENFEYETLKKFYYDWYRPDLMAFVAVGDFDMDEMEKMVREYFAKLKNPEIPRERPDFEIPDNPEPLVSIASDKESPYTQIIVLNKTDVEDEITWADYRKSISIGLFTGMINQRLNEKLELENPPYLYVGTDYGSFAVRSKNAYQQFSVVDEQGVEKGLATLMEENERVKRYGFTQGELDRMKQNLMSRYEKLYNEKDKTESGSLVDEYTRNFLEGEPVPGIEKEYAFIQEHLGGIRLEEINGLAEKWIVDENKVIVLWAPDKEGLELPSEERLLAILDEAKGADLEPYEDKLSGISLLETVPETGTVVSKKSREELGVLELELSNGVKVVLKSTDFKNDEVILSAFSEGGQSLYPDQDNFSARAASSVINESGVGNFSPSDLSKMLSGKTVSVSPYISSYEEGLNGSCVTKDMTSMFELVHLYFTNPRKDETSFKSFINKERAMVKNQLSDPVNYFYNQYRKVIARDHPRGNYIMSEDDLDKIDFERVYEIYRERFADAGDFTFVIAGAFDTEEIIPLLETYLGSLPSLGGKEAYKDLNIRPPKHPVEEKVYMGVDPKSFVAIYMNREKKYDPLTAHRFWTLSGILDRKYVEVLREEMSGVYSMGTMGSASRVPYERYNLQIIIPCSPDNVDSLSIAALEEIRKIQKNGVSAADIQKAKEIQKREKEEQLKTNSYWVSALKSGYMSGDFSNLTEYSKWIESLNSKEIRKVSKKYLDPDNYIRVVLYPEDYK